MNLFLPSLQAYALAVTALVVLLDLLATRTTLARIASKTIINPEDAAVQKDATLALADTAAVQRVQRAHRNLVETSAPFFAIGLLFALTTPDALVTRSVFAVYVAARVAHAAFYLSAKQPFRTVSFVIGKFCLLGMAARVGWVVLTGA